VRVNKRRIDSANGAPQLNNRPYVPNIADSSPHLNVIDPGTHLNHQVQQGLVIPGA
jgi:hypothetical protein